jgi:speckle-type POZ protein
MAAPAASGAAVPARGDAPGSCTASTTTLTRRGVHTHVWRLEGVTPADFTDAAVSDTLSSGEFVALGFAWCLEMRPNGNAHEYAGHIGLVLKLLTPHSNVPAVNFELCIKQHVSRGCKNFSSLVPMRMGASMFPTFPPPQGFSATWGPPNLVPHAQLLADFDAYAPGGVLRVEVKLWQQRSATAEASPNPVFTTALPPRLAHDFGALLASGDDADVTLVCGEERMPAHRVVLCARSPVFAAQLRAGPLQADASAVPVPPDITPHTLRLLLRFLYTDEPEPSSPEEATHLLNAADHYGVPRLFAICALCAALCVDNAAETLTLAGQHGADALKDAALRFVAKNALAVMASPGWAHLQTSQPALITEALHTLATGAPPAPAAPAEGDEGDAGGVGDDAERRVRRRTR